MKKIFISFAAIALMLASSCVELDLNPLSEGSSENWYSSPEEFEMATADIYRTAFYQVDGTLWGDDQVNRAEVAGFFKGSITSEHSTICTKWTNYYKGITRCLRTLANIEKGRSMGISEDKLKQYQGEAYCYIGYAYGMLTFHWGDVVFYNESVTLDEAYNLPRTPKKDVLAYAYDCFDKAIEMLPDSYTGVQRMTKGAAMGLKARVALYHGDYAVCEKAAKACMDLNIYKLEPNYSDLFTCVYSDEYMFVYKGDVTLQVYYHPGPDNIKDLLPRNVGGWEGYDPSYELFYAYPCTDGLPVDESPLFDPKDPWANRDPRLAQTIVPFATAKKKAELGANYNPADYGFLGVEYTPDPNTYEVTDLKTGKKISNKDSKARAEHASYNGLIMKKFVDETWLDNELKGTDNAMIYLRYGDVLLMYAEAMIEQNKCTQEILDATLNKIRERGYNGSGLQYPRIMMGTQQQLRTVLRTERFIEMAFEQHRFPDLLRWKMAEKFGNTPQYYLDRAWSGSSSWKGDMSKVSATYKQMCQNWKDGNYPTGGTPQIDENGIADLKYMVDAGYIVVAAERFFDPKRDYLWPIPAADLLINPKLSQNPGY